MREAAADALAEQEEGGDGDEDRRHVGKERGVGNAGIEKGQMPEGDVGGECEADGDEEPEVSAGQSSTGAWRATSDRRAPMAKKIGNAKARR